MAEIGRREALAKAWDDAAKIGDEGSEKPDSEHKEPIDVKAPEVKDEKPEEKGVEDKIVVDPDETSKAAYTEEKKAAAAREQPVQPQVTDKPPVAWKPATKEQWSKLPAEVRAEVNRREREMQERLNQTDKIQKFAQDFAQIVDPYKHLIAQSGSTPLRAVENLMRTAGRLQTGTPEQRAQVVAEIIGNYGIDIATLDRVLSGVVKDGRVPSQQPVAEAPPQWAKPMFDFMQNIQMQQQAHQIRMKEQVTTEIDKIAEKPFFEDVREDMADIMELAEKRGVQLTLEQAYEKAIKQNDEISRILAQRKAAEQARSPVSEAAATLARARKAASTVSGAPTSTNIAGRTAPKTRREALEQAWEDATSR